MDAVPDAAAYFDIGDTLASVTLSASGNRIESLVAYPYVPAVLSELRDRGVRLGVLSDRGPLAAEDVNRALEAAGLLELFAPELVMYDRKDSPRAFEQAARRAGTPERLLFIGEDPAERGHARRAGFRAVPHPRLAVAALEEQAALHYVRVSVPAGRADGGWQAELASVPLLPLHVVGGAGTTVYGIATAAAASRLEDLGFPVDRLGAADEPVTTDLYLLHDFTTEALAPGVVATTDEGLLVAVPAGATVESLHITSGRHGHNLKLLPLPGPIGPVGPVDGPVGLVRARPAEAVIDPAEREVLDARIQAEHLRRSVERYSGAQPVDAGVVIESRHVHHADNAAAVTALVDDLERIGSGRLVVARHRFTHEGKRLENVEAELPGNGLDGVVLVSAHLDSTGARQVGYRPAQDPAPGADDDASGIAGVLAAAEAIEALDAALQVPRRAVRFALFNAEEHGLVGSNAYARDQAAMGTPIVAVLQMDMIGYDVRPDRSFELHAGFTPSSTVEADSLALARTVAELVPQVSPTLPPPQLYPADGEPDPAERRSDHYSFQLHGFAACLTSEDLFAGPGPDAPAEEMNPEYHMPTDTRINAEYAADIARLVTAAAWVAATR